MDISKLQRFEFKKQIGVYFLFNKDTLCYIGKSENIMNRVSSHHLKEFTHYAYIECLNDDEAKKLETILIKQFQPCLNNALTDSYLDTTYGGQKLFIYDKVIKTTESFTIYKAMDKYPYLNRSKMAAILTRKKVGAKKIPIPAYEDEKVIIN